MRFPVRPVFSALALTAALLAGCGGTPPATEIGESTPATTAGIADEVRDVRAAALETVARGILYKPSADSEGLLAHELAPLLIQDLAGEGAAAPAVETVRWLQDETTIEGRIHERWTFFWQVGQRGTQAIRMTFDGAGSPAIWEILRGRTSRRPVYVSTALEAAAAEIHDAPAEGGFATERPGGEGWLVARAIEAGPMAMGPFVTLAGAGGEAVSLICRCMPTQVLDIPTTATYRLSEATGDERSLPDWGKTTVADGLRLDGVDF